MRKHVFYMIAIVFATLKVTGAEVIDIEEIIAKISSRDSILKRYTVKLDQAYYTSVCNSNYLALIARKTNTDKRVLLFDYNNHMTTTKDKTFISFLPDINAYFVSSPWEENDLRNEIYSFSGELLKSFHGARPSITPGGKYIYTKSDMMSWRPLKIYDNDMNELYEFPLGRSYTANALSDSLMMIVEEDLISLWDIDHKSIIWNIEFPESSLYVDNYFGIKFSPSRKIALIQNMHVSHFVDVNGTLLWSNYNQGSGHIGISASDTLISFVSGGFSHLVFVLYSLSGEKLSESDTYIGPDLVRASVWDRTIYVDEGFQLARFTARKINSHKELYFTGICTKIDGEYTVFAIDGFWYYLEKNDSEGTLVGFRNDQTEIVGYYVILK